MKILVKEIITLILGSIFVTMPIDASGYVALHPNFLGLKKVQPGVATNTVSKELLATTKMTSPLIATIHTAATIASTLALGAIGAEAGCCQTNNPAVKFVIPCALIAWGIFTIVVAYIITQLWRYCMDHFDGSDPTPLPIPPNTNNPSITSTLVGPLMKQVKATPVNVGPGNPDYLTVRDPHVYRGSFAMGYVAEPLRSGRSGFVMIPIGMVMGSNGPIAKLGQPSWSTAMCSSNTYFSTIEQSFGGRPDPSKPKYSIDGNPVSEIPGIGFSGGIFTVTNGISPSRDVVHQRRAVGGGNWESFFTNRVMDGATIWIEDGTAPSNGALYRTLVGSASK